MLFLYMVCLTVGLASMTVYPTSQPLDVLRAAIRGPAQGQVQRWPPKGHHYCLLNY
jgi:hypothetical protein